MVHLVLFMVSVCYQPPPVASIVLSSYIHTSLVGADYIRANYIVLQRADKENRKLLLKVEYETKLAEVSASSDEDDEGIIVLILYS